MMMPEQLTAIPQPDTPLQDIPVPPSPQAGKSSNEILCELFGAFNATPPPLDDITPQDSQSITSEKSHKKHKKRSKKKHKKEKKKKRSVSSNSTSSTEPKKKHSKKHKKCSSKHSASESEHADTKKKKKRKLGKFSASDTDSDEDEPRKKKDKCSNKKDLNNEHKYNKVKIKKEKEDNNVAKVKDDKPNVSADPNSIQENVLKHAVNEIVDQVIDSTNLSINTTNVKVEPNISEIVDLQTIPIPIKQEPQSDSCPDKKAQSKDPAKDYCENSNAFDKPLAVANVFVDDLIECGLKKDNLEMKADKPKLVGGKITIQNLKFSQVYEATVKQIEEEAKLKAEKYEEGELSESSVELERSPTPSELSTSGSVEEVELEKPPVERKCHRRHRKKERHRHRDRKRSSSKEKHRSHSHKERSDSHHCHRKRHRTQSSEQTRERTVEREKSTVEREKSTVEREKSAVEREKSRSRERSEKHRHRQGRSGRSHSRDRSKRNSEEKIDKQKLLEIARKNALSMMKNPSGAQEQTKVAITSGGKTVNELTDFCKLLSKKDADGHESISSNTSHSSDSESEKPFHHPFQIKDRPSSIVLNIRNSVALPVKSLQEKTAEQSRQLRLQFPVSSGQLHRKTESEWIPVSPKKAEIPAPTNTQVAVVKATAKPGSKVFKDTPDPPDMDIGAIVSQRLMALRKLQENPTDSDALSQMYTAQQNMQNWAESKQLPPGQFTGSTGVKVLSQAELASGYQAWVRRDQLQVAAPVNSGMGMTLLQKMGWRPGEGLGKNKEGTLQPLLLEIKMDKKGLVAQEELPSRPPHLMTRGPPKSLEGKHPVSLLNEYCSRRKLGPPYFEIVDEAGPDHKKNFLFKVRVNGVEYKPAVGSPKKKQARAEAAEVCLKALGVAINK